MQLDYRNLNDVARPELIRGADLLLWRRLPREASIVRRVVAACGRGDHYHAAMAGWLNGGLFCLETRSLTGARAVTLSSQVERYPGRIDVFEANAADRWPEFWRLGAKVAMYRLMGKCYGWRAVFAAALLHLPIVRCFVRASAEDEAIERWPPFCSQAVAWATRTGGGVDPVSHLADRLTEPADLARSQFYRYRFTLI